LEKDEYSTVLLECLNEYSNSNAPQEVQEAKKKFAEIKERCDCNLFEELEILDLFRNGNLDKERKDKLLNSLVCDCQNRPLEPELTEEQQARTAELRLRAQAEIEEIFSKKEE
jgi:hypothetical protein